MSEDILQKLITIHKNGNVEQAIEGYLLQINHCKTSKTLAQYHELLGIAYAQIDDLAKSLVHFKTANQLAPEILSIQSNLATCYKKLNQTTKAIETYANILKHHPAQCIPLNNLANIYLHQGKLDQAENLLKKAIFVHPKYPDAYFNLGLVIQKRNQPAIDYFKQAAALGHTQAPYQVAQHYESSQQFEPAKEAYKAAVDNNPLHALSHHGLARTLLALGEDEEAIGSFIEAQRIDPTIPHLMDNIATYYHVKGLHANAIEYWSKVPKTENNIIDIHYNTAVAYQYLNRHEDALEYFLNVLSLDPDHVNSHMNIAAIALQNNQIKKALNHYEIAQNLAPDNPDLDFIISALKQKSGHIKTAPTDYVSNLFNQYAGHYDDHLVNMLRYQLPEKIELMLYEQLTAEQKLTSLDLGCGTGLMGPLLKPFSKEIIGVDLSQNMLDKAATKHIYTQLNNEDCTAFLYRQLKEQTTSEQFDVIVAAELFPYIGDITEILKLAVQTLKPNGILIFSIEASNQTPNFQLSQNARFQHNPNWVAEILETQTKIIEATPVTLRLHQSKPVSGHLYLTQKSSAV
ncbi:MAG: tetratricopeptide repeat protein [Pseudomonadota bacterium]|nr:tetratricopeptide repeat protein [Pseudomonadota bacterium]